jgi:hypothetical protein
VKGLPKRDVNDTDCHAEEVRDAEKITRSGARGTYPHLQAIQVSNCIADNQHVSMWLHHHPSGTSQAVFVLDSAPVPQLRQC